MTSPLHVIEVRGDSRARGIQHGRLLREPIRTAVEFYRGFFAKHLALEPDEMRQRAARFVGPTHEMNPLLAAEMEGIAEGSGQALGDVYALSARYEITYEAVKLGECSNVFVGSERSATGHPLLGMNWEWRPEVMDFRAVITSRCDDMPDHLVVTECGQPAKYGLNAAGIAAIETGLGCESNLGTGRNLFALIIRNMLAQRSLADARRAVHEQPPEATISFFPADAGGEALNIECPRGLRERVLRRDEIAWHTNHCLLSVDEPCSFEDSFVRGRRWQEMIAASERRKPDWRTVGAWLADTENGANAICKLPNPALAHRTTYLQTLASIVLDPRSRAMWVSDGPSSQSPYQPFTLDRGTT